MTTTSSAHQAPVGMFDSGIGGLSVLRHIREQLPGESLCYFADSGFAPYGEKTEAEVIQRTLFAARYLVQQGVKAIVVACNTATAAASALLRAQYPDLIVVGVEPGLKPAASLTNTGCVGVLATGNTLTSIKYQHLCEQIQQTMQVRFIHQACPGLAAKIERGELDTEATLLLLEKYLHPIFAAQADIIVLGCTHYPFIENQIQRLAIKESRHPVQLIDTGAAIACQLKFLLEKHQLMNPNNALSSIQCATSGEVHQIRLAFTQLLGFHPAECEAIHIKKISCNLPAS